MPLAEIYTPWSLLSLPRKLRCSEHGQILLNMSLALLALYITFIVAGHVTTVAPLCGVLSALLHYLLLSLFSWMAVEATYLFRKLVVVLESSWRHFVLAAGAAAWSEWVCAWQTPASHMATPQRRSRSLVHSVCAHWWLAALKAEWHSAIEPPLCDSNGSCLSLPTPL